jgi:hypothetical protein
MNSPYESRFERWFYPVGAILAIALAVHDGQALSRQAPAAAQTVQVPARIADLEQAFWRCDYAGAKRAMPFASGDACMTVAETLQARKFGGDFGAMRAWWRENKPAAYAAYDQLNLDD